MPWQYVRIAQQHGACCNYWPRYCSVTWVLKRKIRKHCPAILLPCSHSEISEFKELFKKQNLALKNALR